MKEVVNVEWGTDTKTGEDYIRYIYSDGTDSYNLGGTKAWRNNNPGNIQCSHHVKKYLKSVGCDEGGVAIFPDYETGYKAHEALLRKRSYLDLAIEEAVKRYTDGDSPETQEGYVNYITTQTGMLPAIKIAHAPSLKEQGIQEAA
ncbi:MAG: hypothetical protein OEY64_03735 [Nitrospinota bacterium]|nr:hypothetical protein [Nitrospinota bacterium]